MTVQLPQGALDRVKVLDLTRVAAGPYCTMILADLGADVVKIERPIVGDDSRHMDVSARETSSGYFLGMNKGKRSIALDLKSEEGADAVRLLSGWADVFVENFRLGVIERLGFSYEAIREINPRIVYCSMSSFGGVGPLKDRLGYDIIGQAMSGIMDITGESDRGPSKSGAPVADIATGIFGALGIVTALYERELSGEGQKVETALIGGALSLMSPYIPSRALGTAFGRVGSAHNTLAPYQTFRGSDGHFFVLAIGNDEFWRKTTAVLQADDLAADPSYATNAGRSSHREELAEKLQRYFDRREASEWTKILEAAGIPVSPIFSVDDVIAEKHYREAGFIVELNHPTAGPVPLTVTPLAFSRSTLRIGQPPPMLDEHGEEVRELLLELRESQTDRST
jgi:crotonobetainyl-CoA:carnitine CoA-transferase CaiB-like acyl-CoA transferase